MYVQIIEKTRDNCDKEAETDPEIKGMQSGKHIVTEKKAVVEIRLQVNKRKDKQQNDSAEGHVPEGFPTRIADRPAQPIPASLKRLGH